MAKTLGRIGGAVAAFSLIFLPLASCGQGTLTASNILTADDIWPHKGILFIAILAAVLSIVIVRRSAQLLFGFLGTVAVAVEYLFTQNPANNGGIQLREGAYIALIGFLMILAAGALNRAAAKEKPPEKEKT